MNVLTQSQLLAGRATLALIVLLSSAPSSHSAEGAFPLGAWFYLAEWNGKRPNYLFSMRIEEPDKLSKEELLEHGFKLQGYGSAPCNEWMAGVNVEENSINFSEIGGTTMACMLANNQPDPTEPALFSAMRKIRHWRPKAEPAGQQFDKESGPVFLILYGAQEEMLFARCSVPTEQSSCKWW